MAKFKRVYSRWPMPVGSVGIQPLQSRVIDGSLLTPALLRQYGEKLVVIDEASKALEYCGEGIPAEFLRTCRPRANKTNSTAPAVIAIYGIEAVPVDVVVEQEVVPATEVIEAVEPVETHVEPEAPVHETVEPESHAEAKPKKGRKKKTEDLNPFTE